MGERDGTAIIDRLGDVSSIFLISANLVASSNNRRWPGSDSQCAAANIFSFLRVSGGEATLSNRFSESESDSVCLNTLISA